MSNIKCPHCAREFVRRVARSGLGEIVLGLFYIYPFKCQLCGHRFRSFQRGVRYLRVEEDRREYDRMEVKFPVTFSGQNISGEGMLLNISMAGCSFATSAELGIGMIVKLGLQISGAVAPVTVDAAVVRNVQRGSAGVEFLRWQASERERLQLFVRGLLIDRGAELEPLVSRPESIISR
jgi:PilZ domain-containing protein